MQQQNQHILSSPPQTEDTGEQSFHLDPTTSLWLGRVPTAAFDALLEQADPQAAAPISAEMRANRRLCGRWLAVQRLRLGLSSAVVAERAGMDAPTLRLVETGLADKTQLSAAMCECLSRVLAGAMHDAAWVRDLLAVAVGRATEREAPVLQRILAELPASPVAHGAGTTR
jgi:hypothetical protein